MIGDRDMTGAPSAPRRARVAAPDAPLSEAFGLSGAGDEWLDVARRASAGVDPGFLGPYKLLGRAGSGGQGVVFRALQPGTGREVAIKRLAAGRFAGDEAMARFRREVETTVALSHPGIVTVYGVEIIDGLPVLVMELVDGQPIHHWARAEGRPLRERLAAFLQCCEAIAFAHSRGVIHCDVKPGNILVDAAGRVRVVDFGLARLRDGGPSTTGFRGTPAYAPPEQLARRGHVPDSRSDVYGLGATLYAIAAGRPPFDPDLSVAGLIDAVRTQEPAAFPGRDLFHRELRAIIGKAMAKSPEDRYQSVHDLAVDVRRLLAGEPVTAHPASTLYQLRAFVRRRPIACSAAAVALLAITGLAATSTVLAFSLEARRQELGRALQAAGAAADESRELAQQAVQAKGEAQAEARRAVANAEFLQQFLEDIGTAVQRGELRPDPTILRQARDRLEGEQLSDQPEVRAVLWRSLGLVYIRFGFPLLSAEATDKALALHRLAFSPDHVEMGRCMYVAGLVEEKRRDLERAERYDREAARILARTLGEFNGETAIAVNNLGCVLTDRHKPDEAEECHRRALAIWLRLHGENHRLVAMSLRNMGTLERSRRQFAAAQGYYDRALRIATAACNPGDPMLDTILTNIARLRAAEGEPRAAEAAIRQTIDRQIRLYGEKAPQLGRSYADLAGYEAAQGKHADAIEHLRMAETMYRATYGPVSGHVAALQFLVGESSRATGDLQSAREAYTQALDLARAAVPPDPETEAQARAALNALGTPPASP